jgi:hypothetical protein
LEKSQTDRINVILALSWFQNRSTQKIMAGIPVFNPYFKQLQSVATLESLPAVCVVGLNLEPISLLI